MQSVERDVPNQVAREKYWEEKTLEEKVDTAGYIIERLNDRCNDLEKKLMLLSLHSHQTNGEMVVPIKDKEYVLQNSPRWSVINRQPR